MKWLTPLEDVPIGQRIAITVVVCLIVLFLLALIGFLGGRWDDVHAEGAPLPPSKYDQRMKELTREAAEMAFRDRLMHLYEIWMRDPDTGQPQRAQTGARNARRAFIAVMEANEP